MADTRQNYCQLLGLNPLKESSYSTDAILKKIETKRGKWANDSRNKQNDTEQRFKSERLVEMTSDMESSGRRSSPTARPPSGGRSRS